MIIGVLAEAIHSKISHFSAVFFKVVLRYEDEETRAIAASLIPVETLKARVEAKDPAPEFAKDVLLLELVQWFKEEFFQWHDQPTCETCNVQTHHQGLTPPTSEESRYLAERVESYFCAVCRKSFRFPRWVGAACFWCLSNGRLLLCLEVSRRFRGKACPSRYASVQTAVSFEGENSLISDVSRISSNRYNCPRKLMETRVGRCGEWANVFTLFCLALDFDARCDDLVFLCLSAHFAARL